MTALESLPPERIRSALAALPGWTLEEGGGRSALRRDYRFASFAVAMAFLQDCVEPIEERQHHPEWTNAYDRVSVRLTTHDAGDRVTAADLGLAKILEWVAQRHLG